MRTPLALLLSCLVTRAYAAVSTSGNQTVTLSANATLIGTAPSGHGVQWRVKSVPPSSSCNFPTSGVNDVPVTTTQNPTTALFSHTGTYVLTFTDTTDSGSTDVTITVVKNSDGDGTVSKARRVRIMPLGDSITALDNPGWRWGFQDKLIAGGYQFDLVGGRHLGTKSGYDPDHEGHSGWETVNYPFSQEFAWGIDNGGSGSGYRIDTAGLQPDLVLLMLGTNDAGRGGLTSAQSAERLFKIIDDVFAKVPGGRVIVARIPRLSELIGGQSAPGGVTKAAWIQDYNTHISNRVATRVDAGQKLSVVDMYGAITLADLSDGVHPNAAGYAKMAQVWYDGIVAVTSAGGGPGGGNQPPTVSMATPTGPFTAPATVTLSATATDDGRVAKVEFFNGGSKLGEDTSAPYAFSWTKVPAGTFTLTARATDNEGAATTSGAVSVTVTTASPPANQAPPVDMAVRPVDASGDTADMAARPVDAIPGDRKDVASTAKDTQAMVSTAKDAQGVASTTKGAQADDRGEGTGGGTGEAGGSPGGAKAGGCGCHLGGTRASGRPRSPTFAAIAMVFLAGFLSRIRARRSGSARDHT